MKYLKHLSSEQIIQKTIEDDKVSAALGDLVRAMAQCGRYNVNGGHLLDVIAYRLQAWAEYEEEPEGLE